MFRRFSRSSSQYAPSTAASDISRLLDPYYAAPPPTHIQTPRQYSPNSSPTSSPTSIGSLDNLQPRAYVDAHGDLHDPNYRDFPVMPGRRSSYEQERDNVDVAGDDAHTRFWKQQRRAAARRASQSFVEASSSPAYRASPTFNQTPSYDEYVHEDEPPYNLRSTFDFDDDEKTPKYTLSCGDGLRYQYQALKLSFRLGVHRARRRWRERRASTSTG